MGSSEEIYWNMAKNNRKLDAKMPSLTPMLKNKLFRLYRMIQSTFIAGFWGNAQLAGNASGIIYIVDL